MEPMIRRWVGIAAAGLLFYGFTGSAAPAAEPESIPLAPTDEEQSAPVEMTTDDPVLREQIVAIHGELSKLHQEVALKRKAIRQETDEAQKTVLYAEVEDLQKSAESLDRLLNELVWEARATEWTAIDEALRRVEEMDRRREYRAIQEEVTRDRQE